MLPARIYAVDVGGEVKGSRGQEVCTARPPNAKSIKNIGGRKAKTSTASYEIQLSCVV